MARPNPACRVCGQACATVFSKQIFFFFKQSPTFKNWGIPPFLKNQRCVGSWKKQTSNPGLRYPCEHTGCLWVIPAVWETGCVLTRLLKYQHSLWDPRSQVHSQVSPASHQALKAECAPEEEERELLPSTLLSPVSIWDSTEWLSLSVISFEIPLGQQDLQTVSCFELELVHLHVPLSFFMIHFEITFFNI